MAKDKEIKDVEIEEETKEVVGEAPVADSARSARWKKFLDGYKVLNPVKFASKEANGEFKRIPDSFA